MTAIAFGMKGKMRPQIAPADAHAHVGEELFTTDWLELPESRVVQFRIGTFANEDDADMDQCLTNPVGYENVDGFMLVSLLLPAHFNNNPIGEPGSFGLNYALENVRFPAPVFLGDRVRVVCTLTDVREHSKGVLLTTHNVMELEKSERPCLVADWVVLLRTVDSL
jgi:acyl dehydratase